MNAFSANPVNFVIGIVLLVAVVAYFGWGAIDRVGLATAEVPATVTGRHHNPPGQTYRTTIAGGRAWTLTDPTNESWIVQLSVAGEPNVAVVPKSVHDAVRTGDTVRVQLRRTRLTQRVEIIDVRR